MAETNPGNRRIAVLVVNLILLAGCLASIGLAIAGYSLFRAARPKATLAPTITRLITLTPTSTLSPSPSPTATFTPRPTSTPTITPTPSWSPTPSQTPTITPFPSLTPDQAMVFEGAYKLAAWNAAQADRAVKILQSYPLGMSQEKTDETGQAFFEAFSYPIFALREALLRFPDAPEAETWRWDLAHNLALRGDEKAGEAYAELIATSLNRSQVDLEELYAWFEIHEPRMQFFMVEAPTPPGYLASYIIELRSGSAEPPAHPSDVRESEIEGGSAFIWLLRKSSGYQAHSLLARFDFVNPRKSNWIFADLDNRPENGEEIAVYFSSLEGEGELDPPLVFSLAKGAAVELPFIPARSIFPVGMDFEDHWSYQASAGKGAALVFQTDLYPPCPVRLKLDYKWNGLYFKRADQVIRLAEPPEKLGMCEPLIDLAEHFWGAKSAAEIMTELLPRWPPAFDAVGEPYPADARDEWKYRLAINSLLAEDDETAVRLMNEISSEPAVLSSRWIEPAQLFLATYQKPEDLYRACQVSKYCNPWAALKILARRIPSAVDALQYLREWGVGLVSSGFYDFDDDDETERWFTVRGAPRAKLDFWILPRAGGFHHPVLVGAVESRIPTLDRIADDFIADDGVNYQPATLLDGKIAFSLRRFPDTQAPFIVSVPLRKEYPSRFFVPLRSYREGLFSGASPELIQDQLEKLAKSPGLLCKPTWSCDEYYYLLGLAAELAGDEIAAANIYQRLWLDYSRSPFTTLARLKLFPIRVPSLSPTPTPSLTPTQPIDTVPVTPTGAISAISTPTVTGTPPTATSTFPATATETPDASYPIEAPPPGEGYPDSR